MVPPVIDPGNSAEQLARAARAVGKGLTVETSTLSGRVARQIFAYARDKRIDLIVLGTYGRTGVSHAILGSVAKTVVRLAPCRVLSVPAAVLEPTAPAAAAESHVRQRCPSRR